MAACELYQAVITQWRTAGMQGRLLGLDYNAVDIVMRRLGFDDEVFSQLQIMESETLEFIKQ